MTLEPYESKNAIDILQLRVINYMSELKNKNELLENLNALLSDDQREIYALKAESIKLNIKVNNKHNTQLGILFPWISPKSWKPYRAFRGFCYIFSIWGLKKALSCTFTSKYQFIPKVYSISVYYSQKGIKKGKLHMKFKNALYFFSIHGFIKSLKKLAKKY